MRVNYEGLEKSRDMLGDFALPKCEATWREQAQNLLTMMSKAGYHSPDYHDIKMLDRLVTLQYWYQYDNLGVALTQRRDRFDEWYTQATSPELITRALRWLRENNYVYLKPEVEQNAQKAAQRIRQFRQPLSGLL